MQFGEMLRYCSILFFLALCNAGRSKLITTVAEGFTNNVLPDGKYLPSISIPPRDRRCLKLQCKYICFNGNSVNIEDEIYAVENYDCEMIDELHLYSYDFPNKSISKQFLGKVANLVKHLSIYASNGKTVENIEDGAFESQTLIGVYLENVKLQKIDKGIFENLRDRFTDFTLIQREHPLDYIDANFLEDIKYQIKRINIQSGLVSVTNITNTNCLLNSLEEVNLSNNDFEDSLSESSFSQLSMVEKLNLTHSNISHLPESIFAGIVGTLKLLDLSNNKLKVISQNVFGWRDLGKSLVILLTGNPWKCTCNLRMEMLVILEYQNEKVYCDTPMGVSVTHRKLCISIEESNNTCMEEDCEDGSSAGSFVHPPHMPTQLPALSTEAPLRSTDPAFITDLTTEMSKLVGLQCRKEEGSQKMEDFCIQWPTVQFEIIENEGFEVDIAVHTRINGPYGVLWFSKVTTQYYKMEMNYKDYGLGCNGLLEHITTIRNLMPDTAYTFCMVMKDELTLSPFSCKSVHIGGNLNIKYNAWLTTKMRATGISLVVVGIVLFQFLGILIIFLLIKWKPTLLKGSKRVVIPKNDSANIIVFPENRTMQKLQEKQQQIAKRNSRGSSLRRLSSVSMASLDSNQSYMNPVNPNIYEIIPTYQRYLAPYSSANDVDTSYAEIPFKQKRTSNDPLPAVPTASMPSTPIFVVTNFRTDGTSSCV